MLKAIRNFLQMARNEADSAHAKSSAAESAAGGGQAFSVFWTAVALDGTLAEHDPAAPPDAIGPPVPAMLEHVQSLLAAGECVKIFTARAALPEQLPLIQQWLRENGLPPLEITNKKDYGMVRLYDHRSIPVEPNTGRIISGDCKQGEDVF